MKKNFVSDLRKGSPQFFTGAIEKIMKNKEMIRASEKLVLFSVFLHFVTCK